MAYRNTGRVRRHLESCEVFSLTPLRFSFSSDKGSFQSRLSNFEHSSAKRTLQKAPKNGVEQGRHR
jgi:hypothetical protein